ncbi:MAG: sigma-70 family RNA polymerase sigma factor [Acidobacteriota bacterium]
MKRIEAPDQASVSTSLPDTELISLFHSDPVRAWEIFIHRYADVIFAALQRQGFDYDRAMDRFVYVCEKLADQNFRRLKSVRYTGSRGELTPWLLQVVRNLSINWAQSEEGRKRLLKPITKLSARDQRIFELYFWKGLSPSLICERIEMETNSSIDIADALASLEKIFSLLSQKKLWRLMSNLARARGEISIDEMTEENSFQPADRRASPEEELLEKESDQRLRRAIGGLSTRQRLVVSLRYEEAMSASDIATALNTDEKEIRKILGEALKELKRALKRV